MTAISRADDARRRHPDLDPDPDPARPRLHRTWARALLGGAVMAGALGAGNAGGAALSRAFGVGGYGGHLVSALLVSLLAVPTVLWLRSARPPHRRTPQLGPPVRALYGFCRGVAVTGSSAALVFGAGTAAGWVRWSSLDLASLGWFLLTNALVAMLLEAVPEELTLRGHTWGALRERLGGVGAALGTTAVFLVTPGASTVVQAGVGRLLGVPTPPMGLVPQGQDRFFYPVLLTVFGLTLVAARTSPGPAPLWASIGTHLTFLSVNRVAFDGVRRHAGWSARMAPEHAALLGLGYLAVTAAVFLCLRWWKRPALGEKRNAGTGRGTG